MKYLPFLTTCFKIWMRWTFSNTRKIKANLIRKKKTSFCQIISNFNNTTIPNNSKKINDFARKSALEFGNIRFSAKKATNFCDLEAKDTYLLSWKLNFLLLWQACDFNRNRFSTFVQMGNEIKVLLVLPKKKSSTL